jgi:Zn-dependent peptidase ImmA (M78 family)
MVFHHPVKATEENHLSPAASAKEFMREHWDRRVPVDVSALAESAGARVEGVPVIAGAKSASGCYEVGGDMPTIRYVTSEPPVRQRFTVAHELGHHVLGHARGSEMVFRDAPSNFSRRALDSREREANQFAAEVLMPELALRYYVFDQGITDLAELARKMHVSQVAMQFRLRNLGWIR